ncbi:MAG TPA: beta-ketoacyl synthase N-terminal-like domain-containing protein, partial [Clostridia bacterium]|nr:beta-ketoacyl synthase N-terminal-like domain-containing protein [Clostridia bacterium]
MSNKDTINRYILEGIKDGKLDKDISLLILKEINQNREQVKEDIAITGIACKFPCAKNAKEYWFNLKNGVEVIRDYPDNRARDLGKKINMKAGWLDDIADFDAGFFRISPKEAISMHPSQRMFLETAWEALEDAGYANESIYGSNTGVYVGIDHTYQMDYNNMFDEQDLLVKPVFLCVFSTGKLACNSCNCNIL